MNINDFVVQQSTVVSVVGSNAGTEIWVRHENGAESCYLVSDQDFRVRSGHSITAVLYGQQAVALRNDATMTKIQLLSGEDLLGSAPEVEPKSSTFWICWFLFFTCGGMSFVGIFIVGLQHLLGDSAIANTIASVIGVAILLGLFFGVPYAYIVYPRIRRAKHNRRIKTADAAIDQVYNSL